MRIPALFLRKADPSCSSVHELSGLGPHLARWGRLWGCPGLESRVRLRFEPRLSASLGRCTPAGRSIRLHTALAHGPEPFLLEVVCHELAHVAAWELHGDAIRPHGPEWRALVAAAGYQPSTRLRAPDGLLAPHRSPRRRRRPRYLYDHRCPVCRWHRVARAAVRRWRCPECRANGLEGQLEIWRAKA